MALVTSADTALVEINTSDGIDSDFPASIGFSLARSIRRTLPQTSLFVLVAILLHLGIVMQMLRHMYVMIHLIYQVPLKNANFLFSYVKQSKGHGCT